jgi:3-oxoacyl-[acyl-carrier-protein] synthase II
LRKPSGTANIEALDPEVNLNIVTEKAHTLAPGYAPAGLVNAFGFGGHSVALVITGS